MRIKSIKFEPGTAENSFEVPCDCYLAVSFSQLRWGPKVASQQRHGDAEAGRFNPGFA